VTGAAVKAKTLNPIGARPGQKVVVESSTQKMLGTVTFVYMVPVALFILGYVLTLLLGASVAWQYAVAIAGFLLGIVFAILYDRRLKASGGLTFNIVRLF
jgi:sigma-E factor negative regulatory protein RseC